MHDHDVISSCNHVSLPGNTPRHPGFRHSGSRRSHRGRRGLLSRLKRSFVSQPSLEPVSSDLQSSGAENGESISQKRFLSEAAPVSSSKKNFSIDQVNIRGLFTNSAKLAAHFSLHGAPDLVAVNETFSTKAAEYAELVG